jgi:hypothetical protein
MILLKKQKFYFQDVKEALQMYTYLRNLRTKYIKNYPFLSTIFLYLLQK